jgi:hypothetical protein
MPANGRYLERGVEVAKILESGATWVSETGTTTILTKEANGEWLITCEAHPENGIEGGDKKKLAKDAKNTMDWCGGCRVAAEAKTLVELESMVNEVAADLKAEETTEAKIHGGVYSVTYQASGTGWMTRRLKDGDKVVKSALAHDDNYELVKITTFNDYTIEKEIVVHNLAAEVSLTA